MNNSEKKKSERERLMAESLLSREELHETIHRASMVAYEAGKLEGRRVERKLFEKAIDLNSTSNEIGRYIYLDDLEDGLRELNEQETKVS